MRYIKVALGFLYFITIFVAHIVAANVLPYPINHINIIFITLLLLMIYAKTNYLIWYSLPLLFLSELFSSTPFGINTLSLLASLLILNWILLNVLTTRTILVVAISTVITIASYRIIYLLLLSAFFFARELGGIGITRAMIADFSVELAVNSAVTIVIYAIMSLFIMRRKTRLISENNYAKGYF